MKKTLLTIALASVATTAFADTTFYSFKDGKSEASLSIYGSLFASYNFDQTKTVNYIEVKPETAPAEEVAAEEAEETKTEATTPANTDPNAPAFGYQAAADTTAVTADPNHKFTFGNSYFGVKGSFTDGVLTYGANATFAGPLFGSITKTYTLDDNGEFTTNQDTAKTASWKFWSNDDPLSDYSLSNLYGSIAHVDFGKLSYGKQSSLASMITGTPSTLALNDFGWEASLAGKSNYVLKYTTPSFSGLSLTLSGLYNKSGLADTTGAPVDGASKTTYQAGVTTGYKLGGADLGLTYVYQQDRNSTTSDKPADQFTNGKSKEVHAVALTLAGKMADVSLTAGVSYKNAWAYGVGEVPTNYAIPEKAEAAAKEEEEAEAPVQPADAFVNGFATKIKSHNVGVELGASYSLSQYFMPYANFGYGFYQGTLSNLDLPTPAADLTTTPAEKAEEAAGTPTPAEQRKSPLAVATTYTDFNKFTAHAFKGTLGFSSYLYKNDYVNLKSDISGFYALSKYSTLQLDPTIYGLSSKFDEHTYGAKATLSFNF